MGQWPFGKSADDANRDADEKRSKIERTTVEHGDGSRTDTTRFQLSGAPREVRTDVVTCIDDALGALAREGTLVMHAIDPTRILSFAEGGPPVWSVGIVDVAGERPYRLLVTYGFSHVLSPEPCRDGYDHEYSLALPAEISPQPWADALLRHLSRYVLSSGNELRVGDAMPCNAPITCAPFQPEHHALMPKTSLVAVFVAPDPVLPTIATPHGAIAVRRILGIDQRELEHLIGETRSPEDFLEAYAKNDPLLLSDLKRPSLVAKNATYVARP